MPHREFLVRVEQEHAHDDYHLTVFECRTAIPFASDPAACFHAKTEMTRVTAGGAAEAVALAVADSMKRTPLVRPQ